MAVSYYKDIYNLLSKKHPNRKIYVISDHHFFHNNIIMYERPEFPNLLAMHEYIINSHNATVNPEDIVIFLGDFSFKKNEIKSLLAQLNGFKYLLLGNHDKPEIAKQYGALGFEGVFTAPIKMQDIYLSHEPLVKSEENGIHFKLLVKSFETNLKGYNYHGHIHTTDKSTPPYHNVTCEALGYKPLLIGYTGGLLNADDSPLIINSERFQSILELLRQEKNLDPNLLITDYLYSTMLDANSAYAGSCFVYGSFPLYKKYGYISNFSDLDVALIYNDSISKARNSQRLKETVDRMYTSVIDIDGVNLSFLKRIVNMCAFEMLFASKTGYLAKGALDANLIPFNIYRESDFVPTTERTTIEKILAKEHPEILEGISLPQYNVQYLTPNGDMANLILQILFQKGYDQKKNEAFKKLKYVFKHFGNPEPENITDFENIIIRFFLRNILFFHTLRRASEIEYIKETTFDIDKLLHSLPACLALQLDYIFKNPHSDFNMVLNELHKISFNEIPVFGNEIAKRYK